MTLSIDDAVRGPHRVEITVEVAEDPDTGWLRADSPEWRAPRFSVISGEITESLSDDIARSLKMNITSDYWADVFDAVKDVSPYTTMVKISRTVSIGPDAAAPPVIDVDNIPPLPTHQTIFSARAAGSSSGSEISLQNNVTDQPIGIPSLYGALTTRKIDGFTNLQQFGNPFTPLGGITFSINGFTNNSNFGTPVMSGRVSRAITGHTNNNVVPTPVINGIANRTLLLSTTHLAALKSKLEAAGTNRWKDAWTVIKTTPQPATSTMRSSGQSKNYADPTYVFMPVANPSGFVTIDFATDGANADPKGRCFADDSLAAFTLALRSYVESTIAPSTAASCKSAAITGLMSWTNLTFFDAKTSDLAASGKYWAATGLIHYTNAVALLWADLSSGQRTTIIEWLYAVFMDSKTTTTRSGAVLDAGGTVTIRANSQGGGSLLDALSGASRMSAFAAARLAIGVIMADSRGNTIRDNAITYWRTYAPTWIHLTGGSEPVDTVFGAPYPPRTDSSFNTIDLISQPWYTSTASNTTYGTNFIGALGVEGLVAEDGRDVTHGADILESYCQFQVMATNAGVGNFVDDTGGLNRANDRGALGGETRAGWFREMIDTAWTTTYAGSYSALDASSVKPIGQHNNYSWSVRGIGTRGTSATDTTSTPGASTWDFGGDGWVDNGLMICHWLYAGVKGRTDLPHLTNVIERLRGVPSVSGNPARNVAGPAAGSVTMSSQSPIGTAASWSAFLWDTDDNADAAFTRRFPGDTAPGTFRIGANLESSAATFFSTEDSTDIPGITPSRPPYDKVTIPGQLNSASAKFGNLGVVRLYYGAETAWTNVKTQCQQSVNQGRLPWISLKLSKDPTTQQDAWTRLPSSRPTQLKPLLDSLQDPSTGVKYPVGHPRAGQVADIWLTMWHEPENDTPAQGTPADYIALQQWVRTQIEASVVTTGTRSIAFAPIWEGQQTFDHFTSGTNGSRGRRIDIDAGGNYVSSSTRPNGWYHQAIDQWIVQDTWDFVGVDFYDDGRRSDDYTPAGFLDIDSTIAAGTDGRRVGYGSLPNYAWSQNYFFTNFLAWCKHKVRPFWNQGAGNEGMPWAIGEFGSHHTMSSPPVMYPEYGSASSPSFQPNPDQSDTLQANAMQDFIDYITALDKNDPHRCIGMCWWDASNCRTITTPPPITHAHWFILEDSATVTTSTGANPLGYPRPRNGLDKWREIIASSNALNAGYYGTVDVPGGMTMMANIANFPADATMMAGTILDEVSSEVFSFTEILGIFRVTNVQLGSTAGTTSWSIDVEGYSREVDIRDDRFELGITATGDTVYSHLDAYIREPFRDPPAVIVVNDLPSGHVLLTQTLTAGAVVTTDTDRLGLIKQFEHDTDAWGRFNRVGDYVISAHPKVTDAVKWKIDAGDEGILISYKKDYTREGLYNASVVTGENRETGETFRAVERDTDISSVTFYGGKFGKKPSFYYSPLIRSNTQAQETAVTNLRKQLQVISGVDISSVPNHSIKAGDVITVVYEDGSSETHMVGELTVSFDVTQGMTIKTIADPSTQTEIGT